MTLDTLIQWLETLRTYPVISVGEISLPQMNEYLSKRSIEVPLDLLDSIYYAAPEDDVNSIIKYLQTPVKYYSPDKTDCDYFAIKAFWRAQELFGLNTVGFAIGPTNKGYHAFNCVVLPFGTIRYFEPQKAPGVKGILLPLGVEGYQIDKVLI